MPDNRDKEDTNMTERIRVKKMNDSIYLLDDNGEATGYLVLGEKRAAVIDTMNGWADVAAVCRKITELPITVINTHGHCDHIFGNIYFPGPCLLHPDDFQVAEEMCRMEEFANALKENHLTMPPFAPIQDGDEIDLGGLTLQAILLPGHTRGSICLLLKEQRVLFTGDSINRHLWAQLGESLPMKEIVEQLDKVMWVREKADRILHGHAQDWEPIELLTMMRNAAAEILTADTSKDPDYQWFDGTDKHHPYDEGRATICYREANLGV